ncbi:glycosyltransferase family 4 protein [Sulfitobacter sp. F26169L]|uniref:glycosyltransferase family 4 protein n=1 Tax=Sulfitobacter sp. F26169L TaxID=2996015 RepID=UPI002260E404|nr:glycosyltransferase family 4 protein [Sulfitobacter sp. F26169L]MCX7567491.1 glycosyltransferase family 4 protein [Sulfitobacter sp. F26169L]
MTKYPEQGASSRYRVYQYLDHYRELGTDVAVQSFMDAPLYRLSISRGSQAKKFWMAAKATVRRLAVVWKNRDADALYLQRELLPFGPPVIERLLKRRGMRLIFDYDDALFIKKASRYNRIASFFRSPQKIADIIRMANLTIAGNDWLRDQANSLGGRAITVEVAEDTNRYLSKTYGDGQVTIGWLGSPSTSKYLHLISDQLREVAEAQPLVKWVMVGGGDFEMDGVPWETRDWSFETEKKSLHEFDIGLMPLPNEQWSLGKSGGKARTYMAASVVPVVSAMGYNLQLVDHGRTGILIDNEHSWADELTKLIQSPDKRQRMAEAALQDVKNRFSIDGQAAKIHDAVKALVNDAPS